jgi:hypothetical protein
MVLLRPDGILLVLLPTEVLEGWDCLGGKKQLVPQKDLHTLSLHTLELYYIYTPKLVPILNSSVPSLRLHVNPILHSYFTLQFSSRVISFFWLWERRSGFVLYFILLNNHT